MIKYLDQSNWNLSNTTYVGRRQETREVWLKPEKIIKDNFTCMRGLTLMGANSIKLNWHKWKYYGPWEGNYGMTGHKKCGSDQLCIGRVSRRAPPEYQLRCHMWRSSKHLHKTHIVLHDLFRCEVMKTYIHTINMWHASTALSSTTTEWAALLIHIRKVPGSYFCPETGYPT